MNAPVSPADALRGSLATLLDGLPPRQAAQAVDRLIATYRGATPTDAPILRDRADVAAYAAYRMPATFAAVRAALEAFADAVPQWSPAGHTDVGGGTGAATWAVTATWPGERGVTVLDWAEPALATGREIAAANPALADARWQRARIGSRRSRWTPSISSPSPTCSTNSPPPTAPPSSTPSRTPRSPS